MGASERQRTNLCSIGRTNALLGGPESLVPLLLQLLVNQFVEVKHWSERRKDVWQEWQLAGVGTNVCSVGDKEALLPALQSRPLLAVLLHL